MHFRKFLQVLYGYKKGGTNKHVPISVVYINELWTMLHSNYYHIGAVHVEFLVLTHKLLGGPKEV
jgi:hypothetical protein